MPAESISRNGMGAYRTDGLVCGNLSPVGAGRERSSRRGPAFVLAAVVMIGLLAVPSPAGDVYLRGPDERGEGTLPAATGMPPDIEDFETFTVDIYAEEMPAFAGFQIELDLPSGFYILTSITPPTRNTTFLPEAGSANNGQTVGLYSTELVNPLFPELGYVDKTIPPEEDLIVLNCIFRGNELFDLFGEHVLRQVVLEDESNFDFSYNNIEEGEAGIVACEYSTYTWGGGNIDNDPLFADPGSWQDASDPDPDWWQHCQWEQGDYHLQSEFGRWDADGSGGQAAWTWDDMTSPCVDTGDPASDYSAEPLPNGGRVNMGAYGNTVEASKSGPWWAIPGDATHDCKVNILDLIFVRNRINRDVDSGDNWRADVNQDDKINILDLIFVRNNLNSQCSS